MSPLLHADATSASTEVEVMAGAVSDLSPPPWCQAGGGCSPTCPPRVELAVPSPPSLCEMSPAALSCFVAPQEQPGLASSKLRVWGDLHLRFSLSGHSVLLDPVKGPHHSGCAGDTLLSVPRSPEKGPPPLNFAVKQRMG